MNGASWLGIIGLGLQVLWWFLKRYDAKAGKRKEAVDDLNKAVKNRDKSAHLDALNRLNRLF